MRDKFVRDSVRGPNDRIARDTWNWSRNGDRQCADGPFAYQPGVEKHERFRTGQRIGSDAIGGQPGARDWAIDSGAAYLYRRAEPGLRSPDAQHERSFAAQNLLDGGSDSVCGVLTRCV